jgi:hypothetical protein
LLSGFALAALRLARAVVQLPQRSAQRFNFAFVGELLAFGEFHQFQNFLHLVHGALEGFDDFHHLVNGLTDAGSAVRRFGMRLSNAFR